MEMTNRCERCGVAIDTHYGACPKCGVAHLMAVESEVVAEPSANTVSVPVRRKRTLPNSCLLGTLLFIPVIAIAVMLVHFHLKRQEELDERMSQRQLLRESTAKPMGSEAMVKMMAEHVKKEAPGVVSSVASVNGGALTITVNEGWRALSADKKKEFVDAWSRNWQSLGGHSMVIEVVSEGRAQE